MDIFKKADTLINHFKYGSISIGNKGYKMRWGEFIGIAHLYLNGVDMSHPDLLDPNSSNTFITDFLGQLEKIHEQDRIDFKELGFGIDFASELAEFIAKAANRKMLTEDNDWTEIQERVTDDADWYGDGYKKIWHDNKGILKMKSIDPWNLIWDLEDFYNSAKVEILRKKVKVILDNKRYSEAAKSVLAEKYKEREEEYIDLIQYVDKDKLYIIEQTDKLTLFESEVPKNLAYVKYSYEYRRGKPDTVGKGLFERIMNVIVQSKVARERLAEVQAITTKLLLAKVKSGKGDKMIGKQFQNLKNGLIIPVLTPEEIPQAINLGGGDQVVQLQNTIGEMRQLTSDIWNTPDVLRGEAKTLGAGSSGVAIQSLAEYASSVHKDVKKRYARVAEWEYKTYELPYALKVFDSTDNIKKYLTPMEYNTVRRHIVDYELVQKQIEAEITGEEFNPAIEREKIERSIKDKKLISKDLLEKLRREVKGIKIKISGEKASRQVREDFINKLREDYKMNPEFLKDPTYTAIIKKQANINGLDELEVTELIKNFKR